MFTKRFAQAWVVSLLIVISLITSTFAAEPKKSDSQFGIGDLVEFTTGMGPMLGEVINGPDPSNYYGVLVPSKGKKPINGAKLRLIQVPAHRSRRLPREPLSVGRTEAI